MISLINNAYKIADRNKVILKGNIKLSNNTNCLIFAHYLEISNFIIMGCSSGFYFNIGRKKYYEKS